MRKSYLNGLASFIKLVLVTLDQFRSLNITNGKYPGLAQEVSNAIS
ncbi:hypothetical protein C900_02894 [Fulvivirga imtechensis AK7]|uniref:Uncharacterized protein n=1 Tax=Fulvivirga imtechensis AK7 TaxID=1237149 RepID=L8JUQ4_9BACT|nr:hypothetical protein C900_02894 [Fulvivirga imtechensis AK7]